MFYTFADLLIKVFILCVETVDNKGFQRDNADVAQLVRAADL